jgi:hypothetical protein
MKLLISLCCFLLITIEAIADPVHFPPVMHDYFIQTEKLKINIDPSKIEPSRKPASTTVEDEKEYMDISPEDYPVELKRSLEYLHWSEKQN